ncbi:hypothetical protein ACFQX4_24840 [Roseomonas sp. GCM10028921]
MSGHSRAPLAARSDGARAVIDAHRFLLTFMSLVLSGIALVAGGHVALARKGLLPPPPLAATSCIDSKFSALRDAPLADRTLVAVGSSATWRNLDIPVLETRLPGTRGFNAAPCYLYIDQTDHLTAFLLSRMPEVTTVVTVVAPRDFESCVPEERAFFDTSLAEAYLDRQVPHWLPYITGFRPAYLAREFLARKARMPADAQDPLGSSILRRPHSWRPAPAFDARCYSALTELEATVTSHGARLVVAPLPIMPEWAAQFDPDGSLIKSWTGAIRAALIQPETVIADGTALQWDDTRFADPVHLLYPHHTPFTGFIADAIARHARNQQAGS